MVHRFDGLRHEAVIRGDDEHDDIGDVCSAGAHCGERLVSGSVNEGDCLAVEVDDRRADVLGDSAGFTARDVGLADAVLQRSLAVVDMSHEGDDRTARNNVLRIVLVFKIFRMLGIFGGFGLRLFLLCADNEFDPAFFREFGRDFGRDGLIDAGEHIHAHESADDLVRFFAERLGERLDDDRRGYGDFGFCGTGGFRLFFRMLFRRKIFADKLCDFQRLGRNCGGCVFDVVKTALFNQFTDHIFRRQTVFACEIFDFRCFCRRHIFILRNRT